MFWFVILIAGIITGIFLFLKHKKSKDSSNEAVNRIENQETVEQTVISNPQNTRTEPITNSSATICVSTSSLSSHEVEIMIDENEDVSMIDLGRRSESGGYINWSIYQVIGKSSTTNKKTRDGMKQKIGNMLLDWQNQTDLSVHLRSIQFHTLLSLIK